MRHLVASAVLVLAAAPAARARPGAAPAAPAAATPPAPPAPPAATPPAAAATPAPATPLPTRVLHVPPGAAPAGEPIELVAVIDAPASEQGLVVRWRPAGGGPFRDAPFERSSAGGWYATIPAGAATPPGVEYYIAGRAADGAEHPHFASAAAPQPIVVEPTVSDRLEAQDRARLGDRADTISVDAGGHDFGNRYGHDDYFARAEAAWTHRFLRPLWSTTFGFGALTGRTPAPGGPTALEHDRDARYGFAAVRVRLDPSVFVDARATLGVSEAGFMRGVAGAITLGRPWRSNVEIGGEALDDLGGTGWVRLQWDTAPPLLMGASIVRTDLPGALVSANGLYVRYDVSYRIAGRVTVRGDVSYGARDGAAHVGGGLGTSVDF